MPLPTQVCRNDNQVDDGGGGGRRGISNSDANQWALTASSPPPVCQVRLVVGRSASCGGKSVSEWRVAGRDLRATNTLENKTLEKVQLLLE